MTRKTVSGSGLRTVVLATVVLGLFAPIAAGLWQTGRAAFRRLPAIGLQGPNVDGWHALAALPGLATAVSLPCRRGPAATGLSLLLAVCFCAAAHGRIPAHHGARLLTAFLAMPPAAMAIGLGFVLAPSGWITHAQTPMMAWDRPPELASFHDPIGLAPIVGLMVNEVPFLLLVILSALTQIPMRTQISAGQALGYERGIFWIKIIMPQVWPLIRLPVLVMRAYSLWVVDMALILGPSNQPTLVVLLTRLFSNPDLAILRPASAGGLPQLLLMVLGFALPWTSERPVAWIDRIWLRRSGRRLSAETEPLAATVATFGLILLGALAMASLLLWSFVWRWSWPMFLPDNWSLRSWTSPTTGWANALGNTTVIALCSAELSLLLAVAWLEGEDRARRGRSGQHGGIGGAISADAVSGQRSGDFPDNRGSNAGLVL